MGDDVPQTEEHPGNATMTPRRRLPQDGDAPREENEHHKKNRAGQNNTENELARGYAPEIARRQWRRRRRGHGKRGVWIDSAATIATGVPGGNAAGNASSAGEGKIP
jgi:hypothetical protein